MQSRFTKKAQEALDMRQKQQQCWGMAISVRNIC